MPSSMAEQKNPTSKIPVTVVVRRTIKNGHEEDYEKWVKDTTADLSKFTGYMDITVIRPQITPASKDKSKDYVLIIKFDNYKNLDIWEASEERNKWMDRAKDFTEQVTNQRVTGLEYWFPLPEIPKAMVPKRWKMATVTIIAIYPSSLIVNYLFNLLPFQFPLLIRSLLVSIVLVSSMTYFIMPFATSIFRVWLFKAKK